MLTIALVWCCLILFLWAMLASSKVQEADYSRMRAEEQILELLRERWDLTRKDKNKNKC